MAFPFFPESHPAMTVENFTYMRQQQQQQHQRRLQKLAEGWQTSPSCEKESSSQQTTIDLGARQVDRPRLPKRGLQIFIPAKLRRITSVENANADILNDITSRPSTSNGHDASSSNVSMNTAYTETIYDDTNIASSSSVTSTGSYQQSSSSTTSRSFPPRYSRPLQLSSQPDLYPSTRMFRSCSRLLTNPFSRGFELNPMLLNIPHPLLSSPRQRKRHLRVLDLGGNEGSVYTRTLANLPHTAICQIPQMQVEHQAHTSSPLSFRSNTFGVVSSRTLYKFMSTIHQTHTQDRSRYNENILESWVREIHRILDNHGSFEYIFFERRLNHAGPLARELEPFFYEDQFRFCDHPQNNHSDITGRENCPLCQITETNEPVTAARFLELLANEGFTIEKNMTIMFPISLLSTIFTQDGQRLREDGGQFELDGSHITPMLASLLEKVHEECRESQAAWKCIIGCASKT